VISLQQWAQKHRIPAPAIMELLELFGINNHIVPVTTDTGAEAQAQQKVRLAASKAGVRLWRNNVGAYKDERGNFIRYGLCNDSAKLNDALKSSDLIGIKPGGQLVAREVKRPGWVYKGTDRERAQLAVIQLVKGMGGDAAFTTGEWK